MHQLVVVCAVPDEGRAAWRNELRAIGLADDEVVITGHVDDEVLDALYAQAALFVFTSRYEGFGLPALEAAVAGAPVVTSDVSSLPEVIDHELALVPLDDVDGLAGRMADVLTDPARRDTLVAASARAANRHTWSAVAARTVAAYDIAADRARPRRFPRRSQPVRTRLALVGPYPPSKSGIATWSERLVNALDREADVDVFREGAAVMPDRGRHAVATGRRFPVEAFGRVIGASEYDAPIYTIGNGYHHRHTLDAALRAPGIVWLHETQLAGLYLTRAGLFHPGVEPTPADVERARRTMRDAVTRIHPGTEPLGDDDWWRTEAYDERGLSFLSDVVGSARAVIVSTDVAARAVRAVAPDGLDVHVLPLPFPAASTHRHAAGSRDDGRWIVSLGWVDPIKQPDVLMRAFARVRASVPDVRLAFVGELAPATRDELDALAKELDVSDAVVTTGFVTPDEYGDWIDRADIAVQLRATSRGEASAALNDALAAGIATVTNIPTAKEMPAEAVARLEADGTPLDAALASLLAELLGNDERRIALAAAAQHHAAQWGFADLAARVLEIVGATPRPAITGAERTRPPTAHR
jgi:glycosyltransferase involved in cell wall biosynthesis